jgi:alkaline phosphatase D
MSPEDFLLRRAAAYQAFYEFLPLRRSTMPAGPDALMYRRLRFGSLMDMSVLDTRQYRDDQPCGDRFKPSCPEHMDPNRSIMGAAQREWLFDGLADSEARWNVLAQQVLVSRFRSYDDQGRETWTMDKWDGYPFDRAALFDALADSGAGNPIVLTGDIHSNWVGRLLRDFDDVNSEVLGTEFTCTSLTSGGNGEPSAPIGARALPHNPHFDFYNSQRGYVLCSVTPDVWTSRYRRVPIVEESGGPVEDLATFVVEDGRPGVQPG